MKRKSKYKHIYYDHKTPGRTNRWQVQMTVHGRSFTKFCITERDAAIAADIQLIEMGKDPVNILKKKKL